MPDQSSASSEHALIQEITTPLAALSEDPMKVASEVDFPVVLRGYDRIAVDAYVKKTTQMVAQLQATRSPEAAVRRALDRVGEEVSGILQRAHETAAQITSQSRTEADDRLEVARREAAQIVAAARTEVRELDAETDRVWAERQRIVDDARELARQLLGLADSAADRFPADEENDADPVENAGAPVNERGVDDPGLVGDADAEAVEPPAGRGEEGGAPEEASGAAGDVEERDGGAAARLSSIPGLGDACGSEQHTVEPPEEETLERERTFIRPPKPGQDG